MPSTNGKNRKNNDLRVENRFDPFEHKMSQILDVWIIIRWEFDKPTLGEKHAYFCLAWSQMCPVFHRFHVHWVGMTYAPNKKYRKHEDNKLNVNEKWEKILKTEAIIWMKSESKKENRNICAENSKVWNEVFCAYWYTHFQCEDENEWDHGHTHTSNYIRAFIHSFNYGTDIFRFHSVICAVLFCSVTHWLYNK